MIGIDGDTLSIFIARWLQRYAADALAAVLQLDLSEGELPRALRRLFAVQSAATFGGDSEIFDSDDTTWIDLEIAETVLIMSPVISASESLLILLAPVLEHCDWEKVADELKRPAPGFPGADPTAKPAQPVTIIGTDKKTGESITFDSFAAAEVAGFEGVRIRSAAQRGIRYRKLHWQIQHPETLTP